ncbi:osmiophilic body protein, putative [Plasmodium malariae]|uniref:Osmiophilic body protein, putative n=1 Tax=Plasmodium malariae TaxID=5858 RepID=A0A1D3TFS2_PLAMA|nr:osmiophilic body protein, putative [Plasmodium malariae]SCP03772.1 osmiophilic body protein, putative [Plasmodium malariae]
MKVTLGALFFYLLFIFAKCHNDLNFEKIIKYLKETKLIPEYVPDKLEGAIQIVPPYLIYNYKGKIYYLHNNVDISVVEGNNEEILLTDKEIDEDKAEECHPVPPEEILPPKSEPIPLSIPEEETDLSIIAPVDEDEDLKGMLVDEETGILVPKSSSEIVDTGIKTPVEFQLPAVHELTNEQKEKNTTIYFYNKEGTIFQLKDIIQYKENDQIFKNLGLDYQRFYEESLNEEEEKKKVTTATHNVEMNTYDNFIKALHILLKGDDGKKHYTINNVSKNDIQLFLKEAYINIHNSLKRYVLFSGYSFEDYTYPVDSFSLDNLLNDFFFLTNDNFYSNGSFKNIVNKIKYISTAKDKVSVKKIERTVKRFLRENNLEVIDIKLVHHLFSRNNILNYNENDLIKYAIDLVNISQINISPRVIASIFAYFLQKINIDLMPNYVTMSKNNYTLFMENNDLLIKIELLYREIFKNFFKYTLPADEGDEDEDIKKKETHEKALSMAPWAPNLYSQFDSTYDFLSFKYGLVLFYNSYHKIINYFEENAKIKQIMNIHRKTKKIDTLDKFLNILISLFPINGNSAIASRLSFLSEEKPLKRTLSSIDAFDDDKDDDTEEEEEASKNEQKKKEFKKQIEAELGEERKTLVAQIEEEKTRKKKEEEESIATTDSKHELETQKLEKDEVQQEISQDEEFDRKYEEDYKDELEYIKEREGGSQHTDKPNGDSHSLSTPSFYYNTARKYIYDVMDRSFKDTINLGYQFANEVDKKLREVYTLLKRGSTPNYDELREESIQNGDKLFDQLKEKIKNKENQKNINIYKTEIETELNQIQKKTNGKYMIIEGIISEKYEQYKENVIKLCNKRFYTNFRKMLGKKKMEMLKEFRAALKHALRIVKDFAPSYNEQEYTDTFTKIYEEKKKLYKQEYSKSRRLISKKLDANFHIHLKEHFENKEVIIHQNLQQIREYFLKKIDSIIMELYNDMSVELQIDRLKLKNEKKNIYEKIINIQQEEINFPKDLRALEDNLKQLERENPLKLKEKQDALNNDIANLKEKVQKNKSELLLLKTAFTTVSQQYEQINTKMEVVQELEKKLRLFKYDILKEYKERQLKAEAFVKGANTLSEIYERIETITNYLYLTLEDIYVDETETKLQLTIVKNKKKNVELDIKIIEKFHEINPDEEKMAKNKLNKESSKALDEEITKLKDNLKKLEVKKDIIVHELNYITSDAVHKVPETMKVLLPIELDTHEKKAFEDFVRTLTQDIEVYNSAFKIFIMTIDGNLHEDEDDLIYSYNYMKLAQDKKNRNEKYEVHYERNIQIFSTKVQAFHIDFKNYISLRKKIETDKENEETLLYLERNDIHLENMVHKLKSNMHKNVPDFSYLLTNPVYMTDKINNEKEEAAQAYKSLLETYKNLQTDGNLISEDYRNWIHHDMLYKLTSQRLLVYKAIEKKYIQRSKDVYQNSYDPNKVKEKRIDEVIYDVQTNTYLSTPVMLQYGGEIIWGDPYDKRKYLRVIKEEEKYPYALKEIKDIYVLNKIIKDKLIKSGKLEQFKEYMNSQVYTIVEEKHTASYLFEKEDLDKLNLLTLEGRLIPGNLKNFFTHFNLPDTWKNISEIMDTASEYLKQTDMSYDAIIEIIKFLKENPNVINIRDIITLSENIMNTSNIYFMKPDTLSIYILSVLEMLGIQVQMDDIHKRDTKSKVIIYLNILKSHYKRKEIKTQLQDYVVKFLLPQEILESATYNPKLYELIVAMNQGMDANPILYDNFKKNNLEFYTEFFKAFKLGMNDFIDFFLSKAVSLYPVMTTTEHFLSLYSTAEKRIFLYEIYGYNLASFNTIITKFFYALNPGLREVINDYHLRADELCYKEFKNFDLGEIFTFVKSNLINKLYNNYLKKHKYAAVPPLHALWRLFFYITNKEFLTYSKIKGVVERYFSASIFDRNTKQMIVKLAYSFLTRMNYLSSSYFDSDIEKLINQNDLSLFTEFHTLLNKLNFLFYCKNDKKYLERYIPTNLYENNNTFKIDATLLYREFLNSLPPYVRRPVLNFFETDFIDVTSKLLIHFFTYVQKLIGTEKDPFESEENNKVETFFRLKYRFTKNKNVLEDTYKEFAEHKRGQKENPIILSRRVKYEHSNKKVIYKQYLDMEDIISEKSFISLMQLLLKESISFAELNTHFANFMKKNNFLFPKFDVLKKVIIESEDENFYPNLYKFFYDKFQQLKISQPIQDIYYLFIKKLMEYSIAPASMIKNDVQRDLDDELTIKYYTYIHFLQNLFKCLFDFYNFDDTNNCAQFGNFTNEPLTFEQKILNIMQAPFVDTTKRVTHSPVTEKYKMDNEAIYTHFVKQFIPSSELLDKEELQAEVFKFRFFVSEITKFVIKTILSNMPSSYILSISYEDLNIHLDDILEDMHTYFTTVRKIKQPQEEELPAYPNVKGTVNNFMKNNKEEEKYVPIVQFENIKYYLDNHITEFLLKNNAVFKFFNEFIKNIDKFKQYFPSLSELYLFIDKRVSIINSINHPYYTKRAKTQTIIHVFVDFFKSFGIDLYQL